MTRPTVQITTPYGAFTVSLDPSENLVSTDVLAELSADLAHVCRVKVIAPWREWEFEGRPALLDYARKHNPWSNWQNDEFPAGPDNQGSSYLPSSVNQSFDGAQRRQVAER